jgi:probable rRNA maturation factor
VDPSRPDGDGDEGGVPPRAPFPFSGRRRRLPDEGQLEVFVGDEQDAAPVDGARWQRLAEQVLGHEGVRGDAELSVLFVDEEAMAELNKRFMGADGPTDVLAFPLDDDLVEPGRYPDASTSGPVDPRTRGEPVDPPLLLGDVVVCPAVAARNARARPRPEHGDPYDAEIALLVVHGILHVLGHDHAEAAQAEVMQAKERDLLARYHEAP